MYRKLSITRLFWHLAIFGIYFSVEYLPHTVLNCKVIDPQAKTLSYLSIFSNFSSILSAEIFKAKDIWFQLWMLLLNDESHQKENGTNETKPIVLNTKSIIRMKVNPHILVSLAKGSLSIALTICPPLVNIMWPTVPGLPPWPV